MRIRTGRVSVGPLGFLFIVFPFIMLVVYAGFIGFVILCVLCAIQKLYKEWKKRPPKVKPEPAPNPESDMPEWYKRAS